VLQTPVFVDPIPVFSAAKNRRRFQVSGFCVQTRPGKQVGLASRKRGISARPIYQGRPFWAALLT
jgi:hypothetical protein